MPETFGNNRRIRLRLSALQDRDSALAPVATTWNSLTASSVISIAARWPPICSPKNPLL